MTSGEDRMVVHIDAWRFLLGNNQSWVASKFPATEYFTVCYHARGDTIVKMRHIDVQHFGPLDIRCVSGATSTHVVAWLRLMSTRNSKSLHVRPSSFVTLLTSRERLHTYRMFLSRSERRLLRHTHACMYMSSCVRRCKWSRSNNTKL